MDLTCLYVALYLHSLYLRDENDESGECFSAEAVNLRYIVLRRADLRRANLRAAVLAGASLRNAQLDQASFRQANLCGATFTNVSAREARFDEANCLNLYAGHADLRGASFCGANLTGAVLCDADLRGADFRGANLLGANLLGAKHDATTRWGDRQTLPQGVLELYKCARFSGERETYDRLLTLRVPADAGRTACYTAVHVRCQSAIVLAVEALDGDPPVSAEECDWTTRYKDAVLERFHLGMEFVADDWDPDPTLAYAAGLWAFVTRQAAIDDVRL